MPAANQANAEVQKNKALADKGVYVTPDGHTIKSTAEGLVPINGRGPGDKRVYYNPEEDYYYTKSGGEWGDLSGGPRYVRIELGTRKDKRLRIDYPQDGELYPDYNPILEERTTINPTGVVQVPLAPNNASVRFPADMLVGEGEDYVMFDFYDYKPPFQDKIIQSGNAVNQTLNQYNATGFASEFFKDKAYPQIIMYMPQDIQDAFSAKWEGKKFGNTTAGILASAGRQGVTDKIKNLTKTATKTLEKAGVEAAAEVVTGLAEKITGDQITAGDLFGGISGVARNPNVEVLFQSMELRTFDLTFKMAPYSRTDVDSMEAIHKIFKMAMLPQYKLAEGTKVFGQKNNALQAGFIQVPKVCAVNFMKGSKNNKHLPRYKMCAITDVNLNYTPDNVYAAFNTSSGGGPVATELKITFMETKLIFSEDIQERGF
tara:strand:+ start:381 stop:1670 length:1290 start_codon:yes stop_codon:yes gene_type:complete